MKTIIIILATIFFTSAYTYTEGQMFRRSNKKKPDKTYVISKRSGKVKVRNGSTRKLKFRIKKGNDYFVSIAGKMRNNEVHYRIINSKQKVIFDNSIFEYSSVSKFSCNQNELVTVEIVMPPSLYGINKTKQEKIHFLLAHKKSNNYENNFDINNTPLFVYN